MASRSRGSWRRYDTRSSRSDLELARGLIWRSGRRGRSRAPQNLPLPASYQEEFLWLYNEVHLRQQNAFWLLRISGLLDVALFRWGCERAFHRHDVSRTTLELSGGRVVRTIHLTVAVRVPVVDLSGLPSEFRGRVIEEVALRERLWVYDLRQLPPFRLNLLRIAADEHLLAYGIRHVMSDGRSRRP
jgi:hypothetical protein